LVEIPECRLDDLNGKIHDPSRTYISPPGSKTGLVTVGDRHPAF
jgi:hypothetical protein